MKFVKGISLFLIYPLVMLVIGFFAGIKAVQFFYPGMSGEQVQESTPAPVEWPDHIEAQLKEGSSNAGDIQDNVRNEAQDDFPEVNGTTGKVKSGTGTGEDAPWGYSENSELSNHGLLDSEYGQEEMAAREAASSSETLSADTEYVLEETDILNQSVVETVWKLPHKYIGMNREQFLEAMETYELFPPLSELERGFVGLEVLSFSRERVVVQMNYQYLQPSKGFYLAVEDNEVIVYLEDCRTVYINTGIPLEKLPENMQMQIIQMMWIEDEESLYDFLEAYSS